MKQTENKKKYIIIGIMLTVCIALAGTFAWYTDSGRHIVESEEVEVMAPYYLYLLNEDDEESLQLSIGNLYPGETKQVIIGVSNKAAGETSVDYLVGRNTEFAYELELAYTQNLPITYTVYELVETTEDQKDFTIQNGLMHVKKNMLLTKSGDSAALTVSNNKEMYDDPATVGDESADIINYVQYDLYDNASGSNDLHLTTTVDAQGTTTYDLDYFLIEMEWQDDIAFDDYRKETDLIYIIVKAIQPRPEESVAAP